MAIKTSKMGRLNKLLGIGAKVVGKSITGAVTLKSDLETRVSQAKALAQGLSELKGASMKLGQILSIQGEHFLPPEVTEVLSQLQNTAPPFSGDQIWEIIKKELGDNTKLIKDFEKSPLAAASIGQVHKATLHTGEECAIKVQYPGVGNAIDSEMDLLKKILRPISKVYVGKLEVDHLVEELKSVLKQEVDYTIEKSYMDSFREALKDKPHIIVPKTYDQLSTKKVLTMSFEEGSSLKEVKYLFLNQEQKNMVGEWITDLFLWELYKYRTVQTDPNFANFLLRSNEKGDPTHLVLLDFGACKTYAPDFLDTYKKIAIAAFRKDRQEMLKLAHSVGFLDQSESEETKDLFYHMVYLSIVPIMQDDFDYETSDLPKEIVKASFDFIKSVRQTPPPREAIFLNRKIGGIYNMLRQMGTKKNFRALAESYYGVKLTNS